MHTRAYATNIYFEIHFCAFSRTPIPIILFKSWPRKLCTTTHVHIPPKHSYLFLCQPDPCAIEGGTLLRGDIKPFLWSCSLRNSCFSAVRLVAGGSSGFMVWRSRLDIAVVPQEIRPQVATAAPSSFFVVQKTNTFLSSPLRQQSELTEAQQS